MKQNALRKVGLSLGILGTALAAQAGVLRLPETAARPVQHTASVTAAAPTYTYTLLDYPGSFSNFGTGINPGANGFDAQIVGAYQFVGSDTLQSGFLLGVLNLGAVSETYQAIDDPAGPAPQQPYSINDFGQIVGDYIDSSGIFHSYLRSGGQFIPLEVPFTGAAGTWGPAINNAGVIVGVWIDSAGNYHGYKLIGGHFTSVDYPGAVATLLTGINGLGHIAGEWLDANGNYHGFLLRDGNYTSIDYPGALDTFPGSLNDADQVVLTTCQTTACVSSGVGQQGFVLSNGTFNALAVPGEVGTSLSGISNFGLITGNYIDAAGFDHTFLAIPSSAGAPNR